jgi:hypothetical protein
MVTLITTATTAWAEVIVTAVTAWTLQNVGTEPIWVRLDDGTPEVTEVGMLLQVGNFLQGDPNNVGDVWVKSVRGTCKVAITK